MVKLADTPDLGSGAKACRFESCCGYRGVEQLEARWAHNPEVAGSSPASAIFAGVVELADTSDLSSDGITTVWVQVPPPVLSGCSVVRHHA